MQLEAGEQSQTGTQEDKPESTRRLRPIGSQAALSFPESTTLMPDGELQKT